MCVTLQRVQRLTRFQDVSFHSSIKDSLQTDLEKIGSIWNGCDLWEQNPHWLAPACVNKNSATEKENANRISLNATEGQPDSWSIYGALWSHTVVQWW